MSETRASYEQPFDFDVHQWYAAYCRFMEECGKRALELLPSDPPELRIWYTDRRRPEPFEEFEFRILRMSPEVLENYLELITVDMSESVLQERIAKTVERIHRLTGKVFRNLEEFQRAWLEAETEEEPEV